VSTWGSNEELAALGRALPDRFGALVKSDSLQQADERGDDDLLIRADKNPNRAGAFALFPYEDRGIHPLPPGTDLVLVWGEGFDFARVPAGARTIFVSSFQHPSIARADVFIPVSIQTERSGHYTNFQGVVSAFSACFPKPASVADAEILFAAIAVKERAPA
jgi:NADH-quinone oxidoreductase subunit G